MRACLTSAVALAAVVFSFGSLSAQDGCNNGNQQACGGGRCGAHGCRLHHHQKYLEGKDRGFNCGCNGSYNYPVPPLYTYHWPGMYKAERMTDYHSPWRFPPLRPYVDDAVVPVPAGMSNLGAPGDLRPISALMPITGPAVTVGQPESLSDKLLRSFR
jgi:hypothetical protein